MTRRNGFLLPGQVAACVGESATFLALLLACFGCACGEVVFHERDRFAADFAVECVRGRTQVAFTRPAEHAGPQELPRVTVLMRSSSPYQSRSPTTCDVVPPLPAFEKVAQDVL